MKTKFKIGTKVYVKSWDINGTIENVLDDLDPVEYIVKNNSGSYGKTTANDLVKIGEIIYAGIDEDDFLTGASRVINNIVTKDGDDQYNNLLAAMLLTYTADLTKELFPDA